MQVRSSSWNSTWNSGLAPNCERSMPRLYIVTLQFNFFGEGCCGFQSPSHVRLFVTPWNAARQASLLPHIFLEFAQVHVHCICDAIQPSHPLTAPLLLPSVFPASGTFPMSRLFVGWQNPWSFSFSISPFSDYSWLIFLKVDLFDLLAVQGTCRSLLQHHSLKASVLWHPASFMVQWSSSHDGTWPLERP